ncbi:13720_t:CDS:2 [Acaulospora colombiana]|uniref:13720_t:CDS:1 n=1 Tax=Acaulospora colombiana TaxID=27376 RepID=A0ACA9LC21_9GLOM|nr:13720_t:CDS:2 [Acaulospora colombiana]
MGKEGKKVKGVLEGGSEDRLDYKNPKVARARLAANAKSAPHFFGNGARTNSFIGETTKESGFECNRRKPVLGQLVNRKSRKMTNRRDWSLGPRPPAWTTLDHSTRTHGSSMVE